MKWSVFNIKVAVKNSSYISKNCRFSHQKKQAHSYEDHFIMREINKESRSKQKIDEIIKQKFEVCEDLVFSNRPLLFLSPLPIATVLLWVILNILNDARTIMCLYTSFVKHDLEHKLRFLLIELIDTIKSIFLQISLILQQLVFH